MKFRFVLELVLIFIGILGIMCLRNSVYACTVTSTGGGALSKSDLEFGVTNDPNIVASAVVNCSNSEGYDLFVKSLNGGKFKHDTLGSGTAVVPYTLKINGNIVDVSTPDEFVLVQSLPPETVHVDEVFSATVSIAGIGAGQAVEGNYGDTLTYLISPPV